LSCSSDAGKTTPSEDGDQDDLKHLLGQPAPDLQGDFALNGKAIKLSDLKGKVVLLDFWAVWCPPCIDSFPYLRGLHNTYKDRGREVVGVPSYFRQLNFDRIRGTVGKVPDLLTRAQEQDMLKDFAAYHKLGYLLMALTPAEWARASSEYNVPGYPAV